MSAPRPRPRGLLLVVLPVLAALLHAAAAGADWKEERERLDRLYTVDRFRIFYTESGANALSPRDRVDEDGDGTPDLIARVAGKLQYANRLFTERFGFTDPLESERFKGRARYIDVHFVRLSGHGSSGDGLHHLNYRLLPGEPAGSLIITLSPDLDRDSVTPEHELFHSFQYGYTRFKNSWLSEGTARWADYAFKESTGHKEYLPKSAAALEVVLGRSYGAKHLWRRLAQLCDTNQRAFTPPAGIDRAHLARLYSAIDFHIYGYPFIRTLYEELAEMERVVAERRGYGTGEWRESQKKSPLNNRYILAALTRTIERFPCAGRGETRAFVAVVEAYLKGLELDRGRDVTERIEVVGDPYAERYPDGPEIQARNIWEMQLFDDAIYLGAGNAANRGPAPNAGPVPIIRLDPRSGRFTTEGRVDDEQIDRYRVIDGRLYIPGADAKESSRLGNFYRRDGEGRWEKVRNLPNALHVFDMAAFDGRLFAAIGTPKGAVVTISEDGGRSWESTHLGARQRVYNLLRVGDGLYAAKQQLAARKRKELPEAEQAAYFSVARYRAGRLEPRPDLTPKVLFPDMPLREGKSTMITRDVAAGGALAYIGAYYYNNPFGVFVASSLEEGAVAVARVALPGDHIPRDLVVRDGRLYILSSKEEERSFKNVVTEVALDDLTSARELFHFTSPTIARSFELHDGDFYFGMGHILKSQRNWRVEELPKETGRILKLSRRNS